MEWIQVAPMFRKENVFVGSRDSLGDCVVVYNGKPLPPRTDLRNHSPAGFNWGYSGSGPAQLALAMLSAVLGDDDAALACYQSFKREVLCNIDSDVWFRPREEVLAWIAEKPERSELLQRN